MSPVAAPAPRTIVAAVALVPGAPPPLRAAVTRIGGLPLVPRGTPWPACAHCELPMQFLLQVRLRDLGALHPQLAADDGLLAVWQCRGPFGCAPAAGGSAARMIPLTDLVLAEGDALPCRRAAVEPTWMAATVAARCDACEQAMTPFVRLRDGDDDDGDDGWALYCERCRAAIWTVELGDAT